MGLSGTLSVGVVALQEDPGPEVTSLHTTPADSVAPKERLLPAEAETIESGSMTTDSQRGVPTLETLPPKSDSIQTRESLAAYWNKDVSESLPQ